MRFRVSSIEPAILDLAMARENEPMFHILVTDDDPGFVHALRRMLETVSHPCELHWAKDGLDALDFLHRRDPHRDAPTPHLILMDVDMPRMNGLRALRAIRSDAALAGIPVIVLSGAAMPAVVRATYMDHGNAFVRKRRDLAQIAELLRAIEAFWMRCAVLPGPADEVASAGGGFGETPLEVESGTPDCDEHYLLRDRFAAAVEEVLALHEQQLQAIAQGDPQCAWFDSLIQGANAKSQAAKRAYLRHLESHGCSNVRAAAAAAG